jgi:nitric oxide reductase subunit B
MKPTCIANTNTITESNFRILLGSDRPATGAGTLMGIITAHYTVEGQALYGLPLSKILPYSISRTWHVQIAILWIATSWLATGLYYGPAISGREPKFQKLGVDFLFIALLVIVVGSMVGQWMGVMQKLGLVKNFWFGHQ